MTLYKSRKCGMLFPLLIVLLTMTASRAELPTRHFPAADWTEFYKYVKRMVRYPAAAQKALLQGSTMIRFKVTNGVLEEPTVVVGLSAACDSAAIKGLKSYKEYQDVKDGDYTLPFTFLLSETNTPVLNEKLAPVKGCKALDEIVIKAYGGLPESVRNGTMESDVRLYDYVLIERRPSFEGGNLALKTYLEKNLVYPKKAERNGLNGKVFVSFVVEVDGTITNVIVEKSLGSGTDEEAERVLRASPKWIPGMQKGKIVRVKYNMAISFGDTPQTFSEPQGVIIKRKTTDQH